MISIPEALLCGAIGIVIAGAGCFVAGAIYGNRSRPAWIHRVPRWLVCPFR